MEEVVRAFNFVIDKGYVSAPAIFKPACSLLSLGRRCTGEPPNGLRNKSRRPTVCDLILRILHSAHADADVATKLGLIAPIAEQCEHQYVLQVFTSYFSYELVRQLAPP